MTSTVDYIRNGVFCFPFPIFPFLIFLFFFPPFPQWGIVLVFQKTVFFSFARVREREKELERGDPDGWTLCNSR